MTQNNKIKQNYTTNTKPKGIGWPRGKKKRKGNQENRLRFYCSCYLKNSFKNETPLYTSTLHKQSLITTENIIIIRSVV
jgi:hypothetical protein